METEDIVNASENIDLLTFREAVESAGHAIYWTDTSGTIEYANRAFEDQTGYDAEEVVGMNASVLQSGVHDDRFYEELWGTILAGDVWNGEIVNERKDNERYVAKQTISPITDESGDIRRFVAVNEEVTELREYRNQLERERNRFVELFNAVPVPLVLSEIRDDTAVVKRTNQSFEREFGYSDEEVVGNSLDDHIVDGDGIEGARTINARIAAGEQVQTEVTRRTADGGERTFLLIATAFSNADSDEALGAYIDITDRKRVEERLLEKNKQLAEFADVVTHDLRNPLNVASGHLDIVSDTTESPHVEKVEAAHRRMRELIENVLMLAKQGKTIDSIERVDLGDVVASSWETIETADARLECDLSTTIRADETRLRQLLGNLFRNAIEHGGDDVTVTVGELADGFYVADDGPGIPEEQRSRVFESGVTTSETGTGLGLSIVDEIVAAHGWSVRIPSSAAGGARFEFTDVDIVDGSPFDKASGTDSDSVHRDGS